MMNSIALVSATILRQAGITALTIVVAMNAVPLVFSQESLDPNLPIKAERSDPVTYEVEFNAIVTAPYHTKTLKVWLPLPQNDLGQEVSDRDLSTFPVAVTPKISKEAVYGNEFAYFEFDHPEGAQIIRHRFRAKVWDLHWNVAPARVTAVTTWPASFQPYLRHQSAIATDSGFQSTIQQIVPKPGAAGNNLVSVMDWVDQNMKYDHVKASLKADAQFAFSNRGGHCSDYHGLCATMGRSIGVPTRVAYGINLFPKNSPSHCKLEAYLPPYGWVNFDVSETQRMVKAIGDDKKLDPTKKEALMQAARERLRSGFRDNTWLFITKGTNYDLAPPAAKPADVVRTIYAEADGVALPDPDPANGEKREFGWMTAHNYKADRVVPYPFKDVKTLSPASPK